MIAELMSKNRWCYYLDLTKPDPENKKRFRVSIVIENHSGHYPTGGNHSGPWYWDEETCKVMNEKRGITEQDTFEIVAHSMRAGKI